MKKIENDDSGIGLKNGIPLAEWISSSFLSPSSLRSPLALITD
jgi:hypothetical protein